VGLGAAALGVGANPLINRILPPPPEFVESAERLAPLLVPETFAQLLITLGVVALLPGICEEVLMRGLVQRSLLSRLRAPAAIGITALLFGVLHLSVYHFIWPAALGVVLGVVALRTGSTVNSMITHATHNGAIVVAGAVPVIREAAGLTAVRDTVQPGWWVAPVGAILMAAALGWIVRNRQ
jgi:membrane protease YdiL (CAAX protease family)